MTSNFLTNPCSCAGTNENCVRCGGWGYLDQIGDGRATPPSQAPSLNLTTKKKKVGKTKTHKVRDLALHTAAAYDLNSTSQFKKNLNLNLKPKHIKPETLPLHTAEAHDQSLLSQFKKLVDMTSNFLTNPCSCASTNKSCVLCGAPGCFAKRSQGGL